MSYRIGFLVSSVPFTPDVVSGKASLGGSESSCLGLARALQARGHDVHILADQLDEAAAGRDAWGVVWHHLSQAQDISQIVDWDVLVSLRFPGILGARLPAKLRWLWNQDLLNTEEYKHGVMSVAWAIDRFVYVSDYHRKQWEGMLEVLAPFGWVTKNGFDPAHVPADVVKQWNRVIHISRPERGLRPLLQMWPALKARVPDAELRLCRYSSMYDAGGWGQVCAAFDRDVQRVNETVGGITYLGELGKAELYREIAESAVMWYPGVHDFGETSCVAAVEAQANGTPFVGSFLGALPETVPGGVLLTGDADRDEAYQVASVGAVAEMMDDCRWKRSRYRSLQQSGRQHVQGYTYAAIAEEWEAEIGRTFDERSQSQRLGVLRQMLHYDDHTAAQALAHDLAQTVTADEDVAEVRDALALCGRVIAGDDHTAENYADRAYADPLWEWENCPRFHAVVPWFEGRTKVLDVACGNGAFAIGLALTHPTIRIVGVDYAQGNIERAKAAAEKAGVADRITFFSAGAWDFHVGAQTPAQRDWWAQLVAEHGPFDGAFCGEFLEHVADAPGLVNTIDSYVTDGALVVFTCPHGPFGEMVPRHIPHHRGHVHHFAHSDLVAVFGAKTDLHAQYFDSGDLTPRGNRVGNWLIRYTKTADAPARPRAVAQTLRTLRPKPRLSVGIIASNSSLDLPKCLDSIWGIADEIVVGDTGSFDNTRAVAENFGRKVRVIDLPSVMDDPDGFAGARNKVLSACRGEWFLWIDTDEVLVGAEALWKYLDSSVYHGFAIHQNHLHLDAAMTTDRPVRLFRKRPDIQFYGCVHEQPQMGDCNGDIWPGLDISDTQIAHVGYLTEGIRIRKMTQRNRALLIRDQERFPDRRLGKLLWVREFAQMGQLAMEREDDHAKARHYFTQCIGLFEKHFMDPSDKFHTVGRPFYELSLQHVTSAMEFDFGIAGKQGGLPKDARARNSRLWVRSLADLRRLMEHRLAEIERQHTPIPLAVAPVVPAPVPVPASTEMAS